MSESAAWAAYAGAVRELDAVRWQEQAATAGLEAGAAEMSAEAGRLEGALQHQERSLVELGGRLRLKPGKLTPVLPPGSPEDPPRLLGAIAEAIREGDRHANAAAERGKYPAFLPRWGTTARNALIYGIVALVVLGAQALYFERTDANPSGLVLLFVYPLIGYVVGLALAGIAARQRIQEGRPPSSSPRLGLLMVFGVAPIAFAGFVLHSFLNR